MDRALKERIIGAGVLVVVVVLVVPVFLDGPPENGEIVSERVPLPGQAVEGETRTVVLDRDRDEPVPVAAAETESRRPQQAQDTAAVEPEPKPEPESAPESEPEPEPAPTRPLARRQVCGQCSSAVLATRKTPSGLRRTFENRDSLPSSASCPPGPASFIVFVSGLRKIVRAPKRWLNGSRRPVTRGRWYHIRDSGCTALTFC